MAKAKSPKRPAATVPLPEIPEKLVPGKITTAGDRYYLTARGKKMEIPVGLTVQKKDLQGMVGKPVLAAFSSEVPSAVVGIFLQPVAGKPFRVPILCYYPAVDVFKKVNVEVRASLLATMTKNGIVSPELSKLVQSGFGR